MREGEQQGRGQTGDVTADPPGVVAHALAELRKRALACAGT
ncbi:MAG: hypothetical protein ACRDTD_30505 [Pseudonocardiaceae bacterium]